MARKKSDDGLTPLELEIMKVLWEAGPATVQAVQERLQERKLAYTTVQTMLNVLHRKGKVRRGLLQGTRAYEYAPAVSRLQAVQRAVGDLVDRLFGGSPEGLVLNLLETRQLSPAQIAELSRRVSESGEVPYGDGERDRQAEGSGEQGNRAQDRTRGKRGARDRKSEGGHGG